MPLFGRKPNIDRLEMKRDVVGLCHALAEGDSDVRASAAKALGKLGDPTAVESLGRALSDTHSGVREYAVDALVAIRDPRVIELFIDELRGPKTSQTELFIDHVASFGDAAVEPIMAALDSGRLARSWAVTILRSIEGSDKAASALAQLEGDIEREIDELAPRLTDATDPQVRQQALKDLNRMVGWKPRNAREALWVELIAIEAPRPAWGLPTYRSQIPSGDPYEQWTGGIIERLLPHGVREVADHILAALEREDFEQKEFLVKLLWGFADKLDERAIEPLAALAEDRDPHVAYYATCALINIKSDEVLPVLARIAKTSRSWKVMKIVGTETSPTDPNENWPIAKEVRAENVEQRRIAEVEWKRRTSQRSAPEADERTATLHAATEARDVGKLLELLGAAFRNEDRRAADKITRGLEKVGSTDLDALMAGLRHDNAMVRWVVAQMLGRIGGSDVVSALRAALEDPDESVREAASVALERIESR